MKKTNVHFSSKTNDWSTPKDFYDELNKEFHFTLDPCPLGWEQMNPDTRPESGLTRSWDNEIVFCNPPYGRTINQWVKKASEAMGGIVVMLIPARTDTKYFHEYIYHKAEIRFIKGRLKFGDSTNSAPFPSMLVIFK
jgi:phage N-6-adenine-methyltransferase